MGLDFFNSCKDDRFDNLNFIRFLIFFGIIGHVRFLHFSLLEESTFELKLESTKKLEKKYRNIYFSVKKNRAHHFGHLRGLSFRPFPLEHSQAQAGARGNMG